MATSGPVVKSAQDKREYRYTQLENGLKVLLIHDADIAESLAQDAAGDAEASFFFGCGGVLARARVGVCGGRQSCEARLRGSIGAPFDLVRRRVSLAFAPRAVP
jgi:hypothetical protein